MAGPHRVILDTDIGSDVDDALALAMLFGTSEAQLLGVTTVYGDVTVRAQIARRLARLAGHDALPVVPGGSHPLSGAEPWWAGFEGRLYADLGTEAYVEDMTATEFLLESVVGRPGEVSVVAIGPLTNIALALRADPAFAQSVRRLYVMGGRFDRPDPEHNVNSDVTAADEVFRSGIPVTVVGLEITTRARIEPDHLAQIAAAGALGRQLEAEVHQWWDFAGKRWNNPHDPLAVLAMLRPDLLGLRRADIRIHTSGEHVGVSEAVEAVEAGTGAELGNGGTYVVDSLDVEAAVGEIVRLIEAAGHRGPS
jgi:purine nucleosidase